MSAGIVLARLGADVILTDLGPNLPLLTDNCKANGTLSSSLHTLLHKCTHHTSMVFVHLVVVLCRAEVPQRSAVIAISMLACYPRKAVLRSLWHLLWVLHIRIFPK